MALEVKESRRVRTERRISKSVQINIIDDEEYEKNKNFFLEIGEPQLVEMSDRKGVTTVDHRSPYPPSSTSASLTPTTCISSLTTSINLLLGLPLFLLPGGSILSILLLIYPMSLICTCPNRLNLASLTLSPKRPTCAVPLINSILILSIVVTPNEHLNIFSSATSSSTSCRLLNATVSKPYIISDCDVLHHKKHLHNMEQGTIMVPHTSYIIKGEYELFSNGSQGVIVVVGAGYSSRQ
ncbi:sodium/calcium exchanger 1 isoform X3 [Silurus meridionalis]|nr:sodium/calcium exchanger 1 isoform X3 [Silurus meridionalis]